MSGGAPHVIVAAAMGVHAAFYRPLVADLEQRGWTATVLPARGIDRDSPPPARDNDWGYADLVETLRDALKAQRSAHPEQPVILLGHSLGGQTIVGHLLDAGDADGVVLVGSSEPYFRHYGRRGLGVLGLALAVPPVTTLWGYWPKQGFGGPQPRTLMREWASYVRSRTLPYPRTRVQRGSIEVPALLVHVEGDVLSVAESARALGRWFDPERVTWWDYLRSAAPAGTSIDHLRWAKAAGPVVDRILTWWENVGED